MLSCQISPSNRRFLNIISTLGWNITLFHYRNHGHDFGRVLIGLLVADIDREAFSAFLDNLEYKNYDETENETYLQFLH